MINQSSIHVLDFNDNIIDYFDATDYAVIEAEHERDISSIFERFDFKVLSERAEKLKDRVRIITYDSQGNPVEFIITRISEGIDGYVDIESNASFLEDMISAEPFEPGSFKAYTSHQFLDEILADTGWERSPDSIFSSGKTITWSDINDRIQMAKLGQTRYDLRLDREIILGRNKVEKRYIKYVEKTPEFYGAEITYGDNMLNLERTIDYSNIVTRMIGYGPQDEEGNRIRVVVDDREAQMQFGIKPIYGVHEINSEDTSMTEQRALTLTTNQLKKQNQEAFSYEISSIDRSGTIGELIRVKNLDFNPAFYADVQAVKEIYYPLTNTSTFTYSFIKEYREEDISRNVLEKMREIAERVTKNLNVEGITETVKENIKDLYEVKIPRQDTPPKNPKDGDLWLDTTNPERNILMKYDDKTGQWVKTSPTEAHEVGAISKEEAFHGELKILLQSSLLSHTNLINTTEEVLDNRYLVDIFVKNDLQLLLDKIISQFGLFRQSVENVDIERVNFYELADIYRMFEDYKVTVFELTELLKKARTLIDERFRLLQSQYTEEKYKEAMEKVAETIGGTFDGENIIADLPNKEDLIQLNKDIKDYLNGEIDSLDDKLGKDIKSVVKDVKDEISASIESVEKKVDGINYENRNLLRDTALTHEGRGAWNRGFNIHTDDIYPYVSQNSSLSVQQSIPLLPAGTYTISTLVKASKETKAIMRWVMPGHTNATANLEKTGEWQRVSYTFTIDEDVENFTIYFTNGDNSTGNEYIKMTHFKLEKGTIATDWTSSSEDMESKLEEITQTVTQNTTSIGLLEREILLKASSSDVTEQLNSALEPVKSSVQTNKSELQVQAGLINQKVNSTQYTADMNNVTKSLETATSERKQLADRINQTVSVDEYSKGNENLLLETHGLVRNTNYNNARYYLAEPIASGEVVTLQIKGRLGNDRTSFGIYNSGGMVNMVNIYPKDLGEDNIYKATFEWKTYRIMNDNEEVVFAANTHLNVYQLPNTGTTPSAIEWVKLEYGSLATPYSKSPQDTETVLTRHTTEIEQTKSEINHRVSYEQFNHSNKTLERFFTQLSQTGTGLSFQIDDNGTIQGFNFNKDQFTIDSNLININNGDVVIKNGTTTITTAMINKLSSNTAFINNLTGNTAFINKIKTYELTANQVQVGFNSITSSVSITGSGLITYSGGKITSVLSGSGHDFYHEGNYIGEIGTGQIANHPNVRGLRFSLSDYGQYMAFSYRTGTINPGDPNEVAMLWSKGSGSYRRGFTFNEDILIDTSRVLETQYIRASNHSSTGQRLYVGHGTLNSVGGITIRYYSFDGSGIHIANNRVDLVSKDVNRDGVGVIGIGYDTTSYLVQSMPVYNRTYSNAPNMYITQYGTIGRSTSALKYKEFVEPQFKTEREQIEHSKKILQIKPKTWYDKQELEITVKEIEADDNNKLDVADDFKLQRHFGAIADEFHDIGMKELVQYGEDGEVESLAYDRIGVHLIPLIKDLYEKVETLEQQNDELKNKLNTQGDK